MIIAVVAKDIHYVIEIIWNTSQIFVIHATWMPILFEKTFISI